MITVCTHLSQELGWTVEFGNERLSLLAEVNEELLTWLRLLVRQSFDWHVRVAGRSLRSNVSEAERFI